jgi:ATP synthase subunit 6
MFTNSFFSSPLEQFQILPIVPLYLGTLDLSITNSTIIFLIVSFLSLILFMGMSKDSRSGHFIVPTRIQSLIEIIYSFISIQISDNLKSDKSQYFVPLIITIFFLVLSLNLIGLIPYSFTLTSHLIVTISFSLALFIGINIIAFKLHGVKCFSLFLPSGTSAVLSLLLVPIELISYVFRPISLGTRLFANMMAGHTLLKVIAGFGYTLMGASGVMFLLHYIPLLVLIPLFVLELSVALIQSFVFMILICIYLYDSIHLH